MKKYSIYPSRLKWPRLILICLVASILIAVVSVGAIRKVYMDNLKPLSSSQKSVLVTIPKGASVQEIGKTLHESGVIRKAFAFEWYVRNAGVRDELKAGTYSLKPSLSISQIVEIITQGNIATDLVTILPGKRIDEIRDNLINEGFDVAKVDAALDPASYPGHPALVDKPTDANLEGYIYPESFQRTAETDPKDIIRQSLDEMQRYLTPDTRAGIVKQGLTIHQGVILASVIEREVDKPEDRSKVAQVFLRRLSEGMRLESDATASYGAILDGQKPSLSYNSRYNTYLNDGLTPGPISNVSKSSLEAVAFPATTDFLYFVSGDDNKTYFSKTLAEHEELTRQHCHEKCKAQ